MEPVCNKWWLLLMLTRIFEHRWHWWQCLSLSASDISDGKSQQWVRQIWLTHYIFSWDQWQKIHWFTCINQRLILWVYGSFTPDFVTDICLNGLILCEPLCLSAVCVVWAEEVRLTLRCWCISHSYTIVFSNRLSVLQLPHNIIWFTA